MDANKTELRIIADFNRGRLTARQAQKMIAKLAIRKIRKTNQRKFK